MSPSNENCEICRSTGLIRWRSTKKGLRFQICSDAVAVTKDFAEYNMHSAAAGSLLGAMETFFCHQARSKVVDQVMNARHGLSHREATATAHPLFIHS